MWFNRKKNFLVTGAKGQLGSYLVKHLSKIAFNQRSDVGQVLGIDIDELDLTKADDVADFFNTHVVCPHVKIDYVIHCAAATDTAAIEQDPLKFYASNVIATRNVARSCAYNSIKMIHISTDYVLSELSPDEFHKPVEFPVNQYGMQKLLAEREVQVAYAAKPKDYVIGRLSWLFGNSQRSFVEKFLRSMFKTYCSEAQSEGKIIHKVVGDAYGRPTPVWKVLYSILAAVDSKSHGTFDFQYGAAQISRFEWAKMILSEFYSMLDSMFFTPACSKWADPILHTRAKDMRERVELAEVKSSDLNLSMRHPGLVTAGPKLEARTTEYEDCTREYIMTNWERLTGMMAEELMKDNK